MEQLIIKENCACLSCLLALLVCLLPTGCSNEIATGGGGSKEIYSLSVKVKDPAVTRAGLEGATDEENRIERIDMTHVEEAGQYGDYELFTGLNPDHIMFRPYVFEDIIGFNRKEIYRIRAVANAPDDFIAK